MVSRTPPRRTSQVESASVVVAVERLTHNVLRCLSDVVQHRAEVPGGPLGDPWDPLGAAQRLGGKVAKLEKIVFFFTETYFINKNGLWFVPSKRVILLANAGIYSIWFKADTHWWCFLLIGIWPARALVFISENGENSATFSNIQVEVARKKFLFRKKHVYLCRHMSTSKTRWCFQQTFAFARDLRCSGKSCTS